MANHKVTIVKYRGNPVTVMAQVETYLETIDSTTAVLFAPPIIVGDANFVTAFIVHTDDT